MYNARITLDLQKYVSENGGLVDGKYMRHIYAGSDSEGWLVGRALDGAGIGVWQRMIFHHEVAQIDCEASSCVATK